MGGDKFKQALKALETRKMLTSMGKVSKVEGNTCVVVRENLPTLTDVRLEAIIETSGNFLLIVPALGSEVICAEIQGAKEETCIIKYTKISKLQLLIDGLEVNVSEGKLKVENESASLKDILTSLLVELKAAIIQTPEGPGSFSLQNVTNFTEIEQKTLNLLS